MDTISESPGDEAVQDLNLLTNADWIAYNTHEVVNNSTYMYISGRTYQVGRSKKDRNVKMEPDEDLEAQANVFSNFEQYVSPLDPNMSSVARYSPVYSEPSTSYNPVIIHQLVASAENAEVLNEYVNAVNTSTSSLDSIPTVLCNDDIRDASDQYLQMLKQEDSTVNISPSNFNVQFVTDHEQEVKVLITDQTTGVSYSISKQALLSGVTVEDHQLLDENDPLKPDLPREPLLDSDLSVLEVNTLKTELHEDMMNANTLKSALSEQIESVLSASAADIMTVNNLNLNQAASSKNDVVTDNEIVYQMPLNCSDNSFDNQQLVVKMEVDNETAANSSIQLLPKLCDNVNRSIVNSRNKKTIPESYLVISKFGEDYVFAKKVLPSRQTHYNISSEELIIDKGALSSKNRNEYFNDALRIDESVLKIDLSNEATSVWTEDSTTPTKANQKEDQKLAGPFPASPVASDSDSWSCYECPESFPTPDQLQLHLDTHDTSMESVSRDQPSARRHRRKTRRVEQALGCRMCKVVYVQPDAVSLREHLAQQHGLKVTGNVREHFGIFINLKCHYCTASFNSDALLKIHNLQHNSDDGCEEQTNHICPACQRKFPTQRQLVTHVTQQHTLPDFQIIRAKSFECPCCYKRFSSADRLQRHMIVHGSEESKPLECKVCKKRFVTGSALKGHIKVHFPGLKFFKCPICNEGFDNILKLKMHVPTHCENNQYVCPHCKKVFRKYSVVRKHIRAFHSDKRHPCEHCQMTFPTMDKLRAHLTKHSDHREFLCADCGKQFKRKDKLMEHCKRKHSEERENKAPSQVKVTSEASSKRNSYKLKATDFHRFIYKCHQCLVGFKRRGMLVNHLANRHPDIPPDSVPELNLPILRTTRDYYCQYCNKVYKSSSKRKIHILKNHPGAELPASNRKQRGTNTGTSGDGNSGAGELSDPTFSQTVGSVTTRPQSCPWCHKQYASKAKLLQHQRKKHPSELERQTLERKQAKQDDSGEIPDETELEMEGDCLPEQYKITDEDILNSSIDDLGDDLVPLTSSDGSFQSTTELDSNSHLYRLLTTANGLPPAT